MQGAEHPTEFLVRAKGRVCTFKKKKKNEVKAIANVNRIFCDRSGKQPRICMVTLDGGGGLGRCGEALQSIVMGELEQFATQACSVQEKDRGSRI